MIFNVISGQTAPIFPLKPALTVDPKTAKSAIEILAKWRFSAPRGGQPQARFGNLPTESDSSRSEGCRRWRSDNQAGSLRRKIRSPFFVSCAVPWLQ